MKSKKRNKGSSQGWSDHYTKKAKADNYPARSVYKLMEIQQKFKVIRKKAAVLDLGCAPGSWLIYAAKTVGPEGTAVGIDLKKVTAPLPANARAVEGDVFDRDGWVEKEEAYDLVLSDMAPKTTGRKDVDALRSFELCRAALDRACELLVPGGGFVCKIFQGGEFKQFETDVKKRFKKCRIFKPESCRKSSKEIYIIGTGKH